MSDQVTDNDLFEDDLEDEAQTPADGGSDGPDSSGETPKERKRFQDAQAALGKEQQRAAKLEAELKRLRAGKDPATSDGDTGKPGIDADLLEDWREAAWERYPKFKDYGIEIDAISGGSRGEIRANAANLVEFIDKVETKVRNKVLAEYGLSSAGLAGGGSSAPDFGAMSDEEFLKFVNKRTP